MTFQELDNDDKACLYIGRFMAAFADLECMLNQIFAILFNLNPSALLLMQSNIDLSKKVELVQYALKQQGLLDNHKTLFKKLEAFQTVRNILSCTQFNGEDGYISFDYANRKGQIALPSDLSESDDKLMGTSISYSNFDMFLAQFPKMINEFCDIKGSCKPLGLGQLSPMDDYLFQLKEEMLSASDTIIEFPKDAP